MQSVRIKKRFIICGFLLLFSSPLFAQFDGTPIDFDNDVNDSGAAAAPIDGFVGIAFLAGVVFGVKKLRGEKMNKKNPFF